MRYDYGCTIIPQKFGERDRPGWFGVLHHMYIYLKETLTLPYLCSILLGSTALFNFPDEFGLVPSGEAPPHLL